MFVHVCSCSWHSCDSVPFRVLSAVHLSKAALAADPPAGFVGLAGMQPGQGAGAATRRLHGRGGRDPRAGQPAVLDSPALQPFCVVAACCSPHPPAAPPPLARSGLPSRFFHAPSVLSFSSPACSFGHILTCQEVMSKREYDTLGDEAKREAAEVAEREGES